MTIPIIMLLKDGRGYFIRGYLKLEEIAKDIESGYYKNIDVIKRYNKVRPRLNKRIHNII